MAELKFRIRRCVGSADVLVILMGTNNIAEYPGETVDRARQLIQCATDLHFSGVANRVLCVEVGETPKLTKPCFQ